MTPTDPTVTTDDFAPAFIDPEASAMNVLAGLMDDLDDDSRDRVLMWAHARFHSANTEPVDPDAPRTHWFEDLPASGDVVHYGGRDHAIVVQVRVDGSRFDYRMTSLDAEVPDGRKGERR